TAACWDPQAPEPAWAARRRPSRQPRPWPSPAPRPLRRPWPPRRRPPEPLVQARPERLEPAPGFPALLRAFPARRSCADLGGCRRGDSLGLAHRHAVDLALQVEEPPEEGLGPRRAAGHVDVHRNDAVH